MIFSPHVSVLYCQVKFVHEDSKDYEDGHNLIIHKFPKWKKNDQSLPAEATQLLYHSSSSSMAWMRRLATSLVC